jgi:hypothetical protein
MDQHFLLGRKVLLYLSLGSSQHKGLEDLVQLTNQLDVFLFGLDACRVGPCFCRVVEPVVKELRIAEDLGKQEIKQTPKLMQIVLQGSSSQEQLALRMQLPHHLGKLTILVFDLMRLIDYDVVPLDFLQTRQTQPHSLKTCHNNVELSLINHIGQNVLTLVSGSNQLGHSRAR